MGFFCFAKTLCALFFDLWTFRRVKWRKWQMSCLPYLAFLVIIKTCSTFCVGPNSVCMGLWQSQYQPRRPHRVFRGQLSERGQHTATNCSRQRRWRCRRRRGGGHDDGRSRIRNEEEEAGMDHKQKLFCFQLIINIVIVFFFVLLQEVKREFLGSIFLTFATRQDAVNFFESNRQSLVFGDQRKLKVKWQKDFFSDRALFNDVFDKETITKTLYISGFDKQVVHASSLS